MHVSGHTRDGGWLAVIAAALWVAASTATAGGPAPLAVASLNPILSDLAREIGGDKVVLIAIMKPGDDEHAFRPSTEDMRRMQAAALVLASGKGLERYLEDVRGALGSGQRLVEVGATIPGVGREFEDEDEDECGQGEDPHWWQSIGNVKRAARIIGKALAETRPEDAAYFREREAVYRARLEALDAWVRGELARVPPEARQMATAHSAFAYFCRDYGFVALPIHGLTAEQEPSPAHLRATVDTIRRAQVRAIFPEVGVNPKILENMVRETGVRVGGRLLTGSPDPAAPTYEAMMRHNVSTIVEGLGGR